MFASSAPRPGRKNVDYHPAHATIILGPILSQRLGQRCPVRLFFGFCLLSQDNAGRCRTMQDNAGQCRAVRDKRGVSRKNQRPCGAFSMIFRAVAPPTGPRRVPQRAWHAWHRQSRHGILHQACFLRSSILSSTSPAHRPHEEFREKISVPAGLFERVVA